MNKQLQQETQASHSGNFFTGLLIGSLAGAATMLLFAPQSGKTTRQQIQQKTTEFRNQTMATVEGAMGQVRGKTDQIKSEVRQKAGELKQQGQEVLVEQLDRVSEAAEKGKRVIQGKQS
jgi:gas vesicle protein